MKKQLRRSTENKVIAGVCGGIAEYFDIDPTLIRLAWVLFCALGGSGVLAYIIAAIIIPGVILSQFEMQIIASAQCALHIYSTLSAMSSREGSE